VRVRLRRPAAVLALVLLAGTTSVGTAHADPTPRPVDDSCPADRVGPAGFDDVDRSHAHRYAIECLTWWEVTRGRSATEYAPDEHVTRAQMATFIANLIRKSGGELPTAERDWFADDNGSPHEPSINELRQADIVAGRPDGTYGPHDLVSRAAMATFLVRAAEFRTGKALERGQNWFTDDEGDVHEPAIDKAATAGFAAGVGEGRYRPLAAVLRGQMASFLTRVLDLFVEEGLSGLPPRPPLPQLDMGGTFDAFGYENRYRDDVVRWLTARLGPEDRAEHGALCVGSEATGWRYSWGGLTVLTQDEAQEYDWQDFPPDFVIGWQYTSVDDGDPALRTTTGITLGSSVADARAAYPDAEEYSHSGQDYLDVFRGDMTNLTMAVTGFADGDTVTALYSGGTCSPPVPQEGPVEAITYWGGGLFETDPARYCPEPDPDGAVTGEWCQRWQHRGPDGDVYWVSQVNAFEPTWALLVVPVDGGWSVTRTHFLDPEDETPAWAEPAADSSEDDAPPECAPAEGTEPPDYCADYA
jgi:hypothetical protein